MTQVWVGVLTYRGNVQKIFPVYKHGHFYHWYHEKRELVIFPSILMYVRSFLRRLRHKDHDSDQWRYPYEQRAALMKNSAPYIMWTGHATFLIQLGNINILTDPIFGDATFLFRRTIPHMSINELPRIDYVLISHNHRDHMDAATLIQIMRSFPQVKFLVPYGDKYWFIHRGIERVEEHFWWDVFEDEHIKFTFLPAHHWSGRGWHDRNKSLWGSWMIEHSEQTIYFAGDSAYWKHFACIAHFFPQIDTVLMPIGPSEPFAYMRKSHLNADLAIKAFLELGAKRFVPMHWGTFYFGTDQFSTSIDRLQCAWERNVTLLKHKELHLLKFCEPLPCAKAQFKIKPQQIILESE